jgi:multiple antibiotic resistance protein
MMEMLVAVVHDLVPLFIIVNPVAAVPLFLSMTEDVGRAHRARTAIYAMLTVGGILGATALFGRSVFEFFGITVDALRIAGGCLLFLYAIDMVQNRQPRMRTTQPELDEGVTKQEVGVIPLGIPMLAGPGAIATTMVLRISGDPGPLGLISLLGAVVLVSASIWLLFLIAVQAQRWLTPTALGIVIRLEALLLAGIAVQMLIVGIHGAFALP